MSKRIKCSCGKKIKDIYSHKRHCPARQSAEQYAEQSALRPAEQTAEHVAEQITTPSINSTKDTLFGNETHTFQELTNEWNKVKEELKVNDDELLPKTYKNVEQNISAGTSSVDGAQFKSYEVLANSLHQSVNDFIIFATKGKLRMQQEQLDRLNECGAQVLHKYDKNGTVARYVPELAYVLTLTDVVAQVLLVMKKDEVKDGGAKDNSGTVGREGQTNQGVTGAS